MVILFSKLGAQVLYFSDIAKTISTFFCLRKATETKKQTKKELTYF